MAEKIERITRNVSMYLEWEIVDGLNFGFRGRSMALRTIVQQWQKFNALQRAVMQGQVTDGEVITRLRELACY